MTIATYDIGTTAVKGVLINEKGEVLSSESKTISTIFDNEKRSRGPRIGMMPFAGFPRDLRPWTRRHPWRRSS